MKASNPVVRQLALPAQSDNPTPTSNLSELRKGLLTRFLYDLLLLFREQLLANHGIVKCKDGQYISRWLMKNLTAIPRRQSVVNSSTTLLVGHVV